jgi:hypothetical protein
MIYFYGAMCNHPRKVVANLFLHIVDRVRDAWTNVQTSLRAVPRRVCSMRSATSLWLQKSENQILALLTASTAFIIALSFHASSSEVKWVRGYVRTGKW